MFEFQLNPRSGQPTYVQIEEQVKRALRMNILVPGDQLPTVREVVASLAINPNTVLKAYRDLEHEGLVGGKPGQGTFVLRSLASPGLHQRVLLQDALVPWIQRAYAAGFDDESIIDLVSLTLHDRHAEETA